MKKFTLAFGYLACLSFASAIALRVNRFPWHDHVFTAAGALMCLYLPLGIIQYKKTQLEKLYPDSIALAVSVFGISLGILFKIQHVSFGTLALLIGEIVFCSIYIPLYLYRKIKTVGHPLMYLAATVGLLFLPLGIYIRINAGVSWGFMLFLFAVPLVFLIFLPLYFRAYQKNPTSFTVDPQKLIFLISIGILFYFFIFRTVYPPK